MTIPPVMSDASSAHWLAKNRRWSGAFSLVEIALALGVMSFAMVGLVGLMPIGLGMFHDDLDRSVHTQVAQRLISETQQTDFNQLVATPQVLRYFDDQGNELAASLKARAIYQANVSVDVTATTLPGAPLPNANLATVYIQVATNPGNVSYKAGAGNRWATPQSVPMSNYTAYVARNK